MIKKWLWIVGLCLLFQSQVFAFSETLDSATPAGSESPTLGDDRIRELKRAFIERLAVDHTWPASGTTYDGATVGYHKKLTLPEQASAPSTPASYGAVYTKDSGTQPELYYREESDGDEVQLTQNGSTNITGVMSVSRGLKVVRTNVTTVTVTADELMVQNSSGSVVRLASVSEAIAITTAGASGLDTGAEDNVWYYIWIIRKSSDGTVNGLLSVESAAGSVTFPAGYDQYALVGAVHNTAGDFVDFFQEGKLYSYKVSSTFASGVTPDKWNTDWSQVLDFTEYVPLGISTIIELETWCNNGGQIKIVNNNALDATTAGSTPQAGIFYQFNVGSVDAQRVTKFHMISSQSLYWQADGTHSIYVRGFEINKLPLG